MRRRLAQGRIWGLGVVWVAGTEPEPAPAAVTTVVHVVHHYLPVPGEQVPELPRQQAAITLIDTAAELSATAADNPTLPPLRAPRRRL